MEALAALLGLAAFALAAWGWGTFASDSQKDFAYRIALGIAALAAAGGWLNLLGIAYPPILWLLLAAGWGFAAREIWIGRKAFRVSFAPSELPWLAVFAAGVFLAATLTPGVVFNPDDDFQVYFVRAVRMLQTGSLGGNPLDTLGLDSLGAHAFLQAFTLLAFDVSYLNAFDAVFCATLSLALIVSLGRRVSAPLLAVFSALACAALLPPQQVNSSPVYAPAALSLALVVALAALSSATPLWRRTLPAGLLLAAMAGIKVTSAALAAPMALAFLALLRVREGTWRATLRIALAVLAWSAAFVLPWVLLNVPRYAGMLAHPRVAEADGGFAATPLDLLKDGVLRWGGTIYAYNAAAALVLAGTIAGLVFVLRRRARPPEADAMLALCIGAVAVYLLYPIPFGTAPGIRQAAPALVAALPCVVLLAACWLGEATLVALGLPVVLALLFVHSQEERVHKAVGLRSIVAFPIYDEEGALRYSAKALGEEGKRIARGVQSLVPPREGVMVLTADPYHLYFARNRIFVATKLGVTSLGRELPLDSRPEAVREYLRGLGVRYVIRETAEWPDKAINAHLAMPFPIDRRSGRHMRWFRDALAALEASSKVVYKEAGVIVIDLEGR